MTDFNTALTIATMINMNQGSYSSGSFMGRHIIREPDNRHTGSFYINGPWLEKQNRSGPSCTVTNTQASPLQKQLEIIKSVFLITDNELAERIGVTRKTLFNWKKLESDPSRDKIQRIFELHLLAKNWKNSQYPSTTMDLSTPVLAGMSIKDMLLEPSINSEKILFAGSRLMHQSLGTVELF